MLTIFMNASKFKGFRRKIIKETTNTDREPFECDLLERYMQIMMFVLPTNQRLERMHCYIPSFHSFPEYCEN